MHPPFFIELLERQWTPDACIDERVPHDEWNWILELWKNARIIVIFG